MRKFLTITTSVALLTTLAACGAMETASISKMSIEDRIKLRDSHMKNISEQDLGDLMKGEDVHPSIELLPDYRQAAMNELHRRTGIPMSQLKIAAKGEIFVGMDIRAALIAWDCWGEENLTVGPWGRHTQYVCGYGSYIYTRNSNRVSSYQS